jgi:hypothetical protein
MPVSPVYVFFPELVFLHYGDPEWYQTNVILVLSPFLTTSNIDSCKPIKLST